MKILNTSFFLIFSFSIILLANLLNAKEAKFAEVNFKTSDNGNICGSLFGKGEKGVILAHGKVFNKESWYGFANVLEENGFKVLAIDFRRYGKSKAGKNTEALELDILGAVDFMKKNGAKEISIIGGS